MPSNDDTCIKSQHPSLDGAVYSYLLNMHYHCHSIKNIDHIPLQTLASRTRLFSALVSIRDTHFSTQIRTHPGNPCPFTRIAPLRLPHSNRIQKLPRKSYFPQK